MRILITWTWTIGAKRDPKATFRMLHAEKGDNRFPVEKQTTAMLGETEWTSVNIGESETNRIRTLAMHALASAHVNANSGARNVTSERVISINGMMTIDLGDVTP